MTGLDTDGPILPQSTRDLVKGCCISKRHPGLQLDKLSLVGVMKSQREELSRVTECQGDAEFLRSLLDRRRVAFDAISAQRFEMTTSGPLTLHLSRSGSLENAGIALHPIYGFVHLPGSGLKGLARAWAETVWAPNQTDPEKAWRRIEQVFGWSAGSEKRKDNWRPRSVDYPQDSASGRIVFYDAWPHQWAPVELDVVNNHHVQYYAGDEDPGDWESPQLAYFLSVRVDSTFEFALYDRGLNGDGLLDLAREWLTAALVVEGAGAKTAAGYGRFMPIKEQSSFREAPLTVRHELRLATPAFLAGARQEESDCDLRPATLRGLLRWWWRTMHSAHMDRATLRSLEKAVWGDTNEGSAVRLSLEPIKRMRPIQHPNKGNEQFLVGNEIIQPSRSRKVTQGLFYASYGMAEKGVYRWYMPAGANWRLTMTARQGHYNSDPANSPVIQIPASMFLEQAEAALWLLARFGGVGSRSRKGFGSLEDLSVHGLASCDECLAAAVRFREHCGLKQDTQSRLDSPVLEDAIMIEKPTPWRNPWFVLDQTGEVLQQFTKELPGEDRVPLGLPRRTGSRTLRAGPIQRHASPALWSLASREGGGLTVRLIAFPAARLPDRNSSEQVLRELGRYAESKLAEKIKQYTNLGKRKPAAGGGTDPAGRLEKGKIVNAVLLETRTKKGGWRARHEPTGKEMPIQNTGEVPEEYKAGDQVELFVFSSDAFKWLSEEVKKQVERRRTAPSRSPGRGPRRGGGTRR